MTQEEKELLLKDLCARLLYRPKGLRIYKNGVCLPDNITIIGFSGRFVDVLEEIGQVEVERVRLYLRPMSSMTEEEDAELLMYLNNSTSEKFSSLYYLSDTEQIEFWEERETNKRDWLSANHFDYRGLIPKGLALEAPEDMYKN